MKKSLVALAALAAVGAASAQSTVTLSGLYTFSYQSDLTSTSGNPVVIPSAGTAAGTALGFSPAKGFAVTDANLKLTAVEDLGGGMRASFDYLLETAAQRGAPVTRADSSISLTSAKLGTVAARNTRTSDLIAGIYSSAIFLADGLYDSTGIVSRSAVDTFGYTTPAFNGFTGSLTFVEGNDGNISKPNTNKSSYVLGVSYAAGPLSVAAAYKSKADNAAASNGLTPKANAELSVSYDFGVARVGYGYDAASVTGASTATTLGAFTTTGALQTVANLQTKSAQGLSVTVPLGAITVGAHYFKRGDAKLADIGAAYAFSKRTSLTTAYGKKSGLPAEAGFNGTQYRVGLRHTF